MSTDDRHAYGDMAPYLYRTTDYGRTWQRLIGPGTPGVRGYAHVIKEDRVNPNILFLGTEFGLFVSLNGGAVVGAVQAQQFPRRRRRARHRAAGPRRRSGARDPRPRHLGDRRHQPAAGADARDARQQCGVIPGTPVEQRIQGNGGWAEGDASFRRRQPAERRVDHLLPEGAARDRADEARDPRCQRQCRRRSPGLQAARAQPRHLVDADQAAAGPAGGLARRLARRMGERFLPGHVYRAADQGRAGLDRAAGARRSTSARPSPSPTGRRSSPRRAGQGHVRADEQARRRDQRRAQQARRSPASATAPADVKSAAAQLTAKADALRKEIVATTGRRRDHRRGAAARACRRRLWRDQLGRGPADGLPDGAHRRARPRAQGCRGAMGSVPGGRSRRPSMRSCRARAFRR